MLKEIGLKKEHKYFIPISSYTGENIRKSSGLKWYDSYLKNIENVRLVYYEPKNLANRIKGIRAAVFYDGPDDIIELSKLHNNANILSIGARFVSKQKSEEIINLWLSTDFEKGRHQKRIDKLDS